MTPLSHQMLSALPIEDGVCDISRLQPEDQGTLLRDREKAMREAGTLDPLIYALQAESAEIIQQLHWVTLGMHDIDGTHTTVGGHKLFPENVTQLNELNALGVENIAVTGRHQWQVEELYANHAGNIGMKDLIIEQGSYMWHGPNNVEYFMGSSAIEEKINTVRCIIAEVIPILEARYNITFETTSLRDGKKNFYPHAHKAMYSIDAHYPDGRKIDDIELDTRIDHDLVATWLEHDPAERVAKPGKSSTGTFEWTPNGLNKKAAVRRYIAESNVQPEWALYLGDSGNDLPVFRDQTLARMIKGVIVNGHTSNALIERAHIASVGVGNAAPILARFIQEKRRYSN